MLAGSDRRDDTLVGMPLAGKRVIDLRATRLEPTEPAGPDNQFDVGLCLDPVDFTQDSLVALIPRIRELLLVRITTGEEHWFTRQVRPLRSVLPYWSLLPFAETSETHSPIPQRLLVIGREAQAVAIAAETRSEVIGMAHGAIRWLDVQRSSRAQLLMGRSEPVRALFVELRQRLMRLASPDNRELMAHIKPLLPTLSLTCRELPPREVDFGTDRYWLRFLQGLVHWIEHDAVTLENPYVRFIRGVSAHGAYDPGMRYQLEDGERALERLKPRLQRFLEVLRDKAARQPLVLYNPSSLASLRAHGYRPSDFTRDRHVTLSTGREYRVECVDGNHRLAALWLCGAGVAPMLPVWTNVHGEDPVLARLRGPGESADFVMEQRVTRAVLELSASPAATIAQAWQAYSTDPGARTTRR